VLRPLLTGIGAVGVVLSLAACGANSNGDSNAGGASEEDCRRGEVWNGSRCVPDGERDDGERADRDNGDAGPQDTLLPDGGLCEPDALQCENATTVRSCNADGTSWTLQPCEQGFGCSNGQCVVGGNGCEPGEVLGCAGTIALRICASNGLDTSAQICPAETPNCQSGTCTAQLCEPGALECENTTTVRSCNADGTEWVLQTCEAGLGCFGGQCIVGGNACEPGEVLGCASTTALRVCSSNGIDDDARDCPAETPDCRSGVCSLQICEPDSLSCNGNDVVQCNSGGDATSVLETCRAACAGGVCVNPCESGVQSYLGCTFFAVDLDQWAPTTPFGVTVSNASASPVEVIAYNGTGAEVARSNVEPDGLTTLRLPNSTISDSSLTSESYRIEATGPVTMHQFNPIDTASAFSTDASLLLPATAVGSEYLVMGWPVPVINYANTYVGVIAVEEGTTIVSITPTTNLLAGLRGIPAGINAGTTGTYSLTRGQVLTLSTWVTAGLDLTGTEISADKNISVFWGSECSNVPLNVTYCDHMEEQLFPVDTWGLDFIGAKFAPRGTEPDLWRILASQDNTLIQTVPAIAGIDGRRINRGEFLEFSATADFVISASAPISVGQFMVSSSYPTPSGFCCAIPRTCSTGTGIGDPAFLIAVPESQFRSDYIVLTPATYQQDFLNIIAPSGAVITLDGSPIASPDARVGGWDIYRRRVEDGVHRLSGTAAFGLYAYGYDCDVSYAYPGGLNLDSL